MVFAVGALLEGLALGCRPFFRFTPTITRSSARFVCHEHTFDGTKARGTTLQDRFRAI